MNAPKHPRVFISYSHESPQHTERVRVLAGHLRTDGCDCSLDLYEPHPAEGWPRWIDTQVDTADFVLVVCTADYYRKSQGRGLPRTGRGVQFEAVLIIDELYAAGMLNERFIPVLYEDLDEELIPRPLRSYTRYRLDQPGGYEVLLRHLTDQPLYPPPPLGRVPDLPSERPPAGDPYPPSRPSRESSRRHLAQDWVGDRTQESTSLIPTSGDQSIELMRHNLELLEHDLRTPSELHFDAADVLEMILGFEGFVREQAFDNAAFTSDRTTAQCVAYAGWYGTIQLLPTHLVELSRVLFRRLATPDPQAAEVQWRINRFLEVAGLEDSSAPIRSPGADEWASFVRSQAGHAERLFKCLQCIRHGRVRNRLLDLVARRVLLPLGASNDPDVELARAELALFQDMLTRFRPEKSFNNFVDAMALTHLCLLIEKYDRYESNSLPLFFSSSPIFALALRRADLASLLHSRRAGVTVLRSVDYLLLRATFVAPGSFGPSREIREISTALESIVGDMQNVGASLRDYDPLKKILDDLRLYRFFESVWIPSLIHGDNTLHSELADIIESLRQRDLTRKVNEAVAELRRDLDRSVSRYRTAIRLFESLEQSVRSSANAEAMLDPALAQHLLPFGLDQAIRSRAAQTAQNLASDLGARDTLTEFVRVCSSSLAEDVSELEVSCAVLWLLQLDEELLKLVPESHRLPALSAGLPVLVLQAASLVRLGRIAETASAIEIIAKPRLDNDGRPQLALAFLARLETLEGWSYSLVDTIANIDSHSESRIRNALYLARAALELLPYDAERHFALDLFVNCCLDLPASKRDPAMLDEGLSALSGNRASHWRSWFPRYDLTIIRCRIQGLSLDSKEKVEVCWLLYQCNDLLAQLPAGSEHDPMVGYYSGYIHHLMRAYECS